MLRCPIQCPKCRRIILDSTQDGGFKLRARLLLFTPEGQAQAMCPSCKHTLDVPIVLQNVSSSKKPFIYVAK